MQKGFTLLSILAVLALLVIFIVSLLYFREIRNATFTTKDFNSNIPINPGTIIAPDETAKWKTYTNTKIGFSIKYPERYPDPALPVGLGPTHYADGIEDNDTVIFGTTSRDAVTLDIIRFKGSLYEFIKEITSNYNLSANYVVEPFHRLNLFKSLKVNGQTALWYERISKQKEGERSSEIYFIFDDHGFILSTSTVNETFSQRELESMLLSFK